MALITVSTRFNCCRSITYTPNEANDNPSNPANCAYARPLLFNTTDVRLPDHQTPSAVRHPRSTGAWAAAGWGGRRSGGRLKNERCGLDRWYFAWFSDRSE